MADVAPSVADIPKTQRAWRSVRRGPPVKSLKLQSDVPVATELHDGQVLVKVEAAALNPVGYKLMKLLPNFLAKRPHVAEFDLAGIIADQKGTQFSKGDRIMGWIQVGTTLKTGQGSLAQYTRMPADCVLKRPDDMSAEDGAGFLLAGMTAYLALVEHAKIEPDQSVFINGGSSAVGGFAIQIAKAKGCKVVASCSAKNIDFVKSLGADEVLDYTASPLRSQLTSNPPNPKFQAFFDCVGLPSSELYTRSKAYLAPNGTFVTVGPQPSSVGTFFQAFNSFYQGVLRPTWLGGVKPKWIIVAAAPKQPFFNEFHQLILEGTIKPMVDSTFEFEDALKAYDRILTGRATGKVVVKISH